MALTPEQRRRRRRYLGSSDTAALFGLDPYRNRSRVYWEKVMALDGPEPRTASTDAGDYLEPAIVQFAEDRIGTVERHVMVVHPSGVLCANLDALVVGRPEGVEAKYDAATAGEWGEEGTDDVPARVLLQCQHQILAANLECVWVPALVLAYRAEFRLYRVEPNAELVEMIETEGTRFWREHVERRLPPPEGLIAPLDLLKRVHREPATVVDLGDEAARAWEELERCRAALRECEARKAEAEAGVLMLLGDAESGRLPDHSTLTYLAQRGAPRVDHEGLRGFMREAYGQYVTQRTHRVLRHRR